MNKGLKKSFAAAGLLLEGLALAVAVGTPWIVLRQGLPSGFWSGFKDEDFRVEVDDWGVPTITGEDGDASVLLAGRRCGDGLSRRMGGRRCG